MFPTLLALAAFFLVSMGVAWAGGDSALRPQHFASPPLVLEEMGPGLAPEVQLDPVVDRSRGYLLDISEDEFSGKSDRVVRNVWDRIRYGFAMEPLRGPLVADRELWYSQRKDLVFGISEKARRYLFHIVEAVEKRGMPMELALLPFVESGFEPGALSTAQAAGGAIIPPPTDSTVTALIIQIGMLGTLVFYGSLLWAALRDADARMFYVIIFLCSLTLNIPEVFPVNFLLGIVLARSLTLARSE